MTRICVTCAAIFIPKGWRGKYCLPCRQKAQLRMKLESQKRRRARRADSERRDHLTEAEIDRIFTAALKEARRQSSGSLEPFRSYGWLYREPRS